MATCGDCTYFTSCFNSHEQPNNEDHEICGRYARHVYVSVECFDMLEAALSPREVIGFYKGCILKYIWREQDKGGWYDLQKAEVYARRLNEFCARIGLSGDVPHDVSIGCARDTD